MLVLTPDQVRRQQTLLAELQFYTGEIDGAPGPKTKAGIDKLAAGFDVGVTVSSDPAAAPVAVGSAGALQSAILSEAARFVGLYEIVSNAKWGGALPDHIALAAEFRKNLVAVGWESGEAYCIAAAESIWMRAFAQVGRSSEFLPLSKLISVSVMGSFNALNKIGRISKVPVPGAIMFMQHGNSALGHAGIVRAVSGSELLTIEANTSPATDDLDNRDGAGKNGGVFKKKRPFTFTVTSGLHLKGFLNPPA